MLVYFWLVMVFALGAVVGSFVNVCIARLPLEKSLAWPGSRCGTCFQPIKWYDNLPLLSYFVLRGRCRICGATFSSRYFWVELTSALGFVGLFYLEVVLNIHQWNPNLAHFWGLQLGVYPWQWVAGFFFHAILFSFLLAASVCDLDGRQIPLSLTLTGTAIGLIGAVLMPWPWPSTPEQALRAIHQAQPPDVGWWQLPPNVNPGVGVYPWPVWGPIPKILQPGGNWQMGLATGLAGALVGTFMLRAVGKLFSTGLGKDALGLGDADLMMMAGAFLGWQPVVVAFFVSAFPALVGGVFQLIKRRDGSIPFGPSLSLGILITMLCWRWITPHVQILFFFGPVLIALVTVGSAFMLLSAFIMRLMRPSRYAADSSKG